MFVCGCLLLIVTLLEWGGSLFCQQGDSPAGDQHTQRVCEVTFLSWRRWFCTSQNLFSSSLISINFSAPLTARNTWWTVGLYCWFSCHYSRIETFPEEHLWVWNRNMPWHRFTAPTVYAIWQITEFCSVCGLIAKEPRTKTQVAVCMWQPACQCVWPLLDLCHNGALAANGWDYWCQC